MKHLIRLALFISCFFSLTVFAGGDHIGNGGDGIVCYSENKAIQSIELLDFYEGRILKGLIPKLKKSESIDQNIKRLFDHLDFYDNKIFDVVSPWYDEFYDEVQFIEGVELTDVEDSDHLFIPKNCEITQLAIQVEPQFPGDRRYIINNDLWVHMDKANQAGLIFHEIIYRNVIENSDDIVNSRSVRYFTSVVGADRLDIFSHQEYLEFIEQELNFHVSPQGSPMEQLVSVPNWQTSFKSGERQLHYKVSFRSDSLVFTNDCQWANIQASVNSSIRLSSKNVSILENSEDTSKDVETGAFCTAAVSISEGAYEILGGKLHWQGFIWRPSNF